MVPANVTPLGSTRKLRWRGLYGEAELYKTALRLYTKPLFRWRKALAASSDGKNLYDFARRGLQNLEVLHRALRDQGFQFRPGLARHYNFNGRRRTLYIYPWEERLVDLLLYRMLNRRLHGWFSPHSYAYRYRAFGLDPCQKRIARVLGSSQAPLYLVKRDVADFFASIDHELLLSELATLIEPGDYLFDLLRQRVRFAYQDGAGLVTATRGVPFGTAVACLFANIYLTRLDRAMTAREGVCYFRYADDVLLISPHRERALAAAEQLGFILDRLRLRSNPNHQLDVAFAPRPVADPQFSWASKFRHLGLEFRPGGEIGLSAINSERFATCFALR